MWKAKIFLEYRSSAADPDTNYDIIRIRSASEMTRDIYYATYRVVWGFGRKLLLLKKESKKQKEKIGKGKKLLKKE